jgi:AcrR family transcriptional regulator
VSTGKTTRERILHAATEEFAEHGFAGARLARIATTAQANKERLYHYFGNKEALFDAVLDDAARRIEEAEPFAADDIGGYVAAMIDFHRANPDLMKLLLAEADHRDRRRLPRGKHRARHYATRVQAIRDAQRDGLVRDEVDPRIVLYLVLALVATAPALPQLTRLILDADPDESAPAELRAGLATLVTKSLGGSAPGRFAPEWRS